MKKSYILSLVIMLFFSMASQGQWFIQNSPTMENLISVYFVSANAGMAVGDNGTMIRTYNGGINWDTIPSVTTSDLKSVVFPISSIGYAVGAEGVILKTLNAGFSWSLLNSVTTETLHSVWFITHDSGYIAGNNAAIYKTTDGGNSWVLANNGTQSNQNVHDMYWFDSNHGFATISQGGLHGILHTTDGGSNWTKYDIGNNIPYCLHFTDQNHGHAAGTSSYIWRTINGGISWVAVDSNNVTTNYVYTGMHYSNFNTGYIVAYDGHIMKTTDGGTSYSPDISVTSNHLMDVYFPIDGIGYIVGYNGIILKMGGGAGLDHFFSEKDVKISIYPNPANDYIDVEIAEGLVELGIFNLEGQELYRENLKQDKNRIDISELSPGMYVIRCRYKEKIYYKTLVKS
ncbi:YCF48-related protein [candidate division KSB1 bacterium]